MEVLRSYLLRIDSSLGSLDFEDVIMILYEDPVYRYFHGIMIIFSFDFESLKEGEFKSSIIKFLRMI
jgi:hypothetical protein